MSPAKRTSPLGELLRYWRGARKMSQLDLALEAEVSPRHISFVETGRSNASRDMILTLCEVLEVPLRERNSLLVAGGLAPVYSQSDLGSEQLSPVKRSLEFLLERHHPYPAVVVDRHWNVLLQNRASIAVIGKMVADPSALSNPLNAMRLLFDPGGLRPHVVNWDELASALIQRMHRDAMHDPGDRVLAELIEELLASDGVPPDWRTPRVTVGHPILVEMRIRNGDVEFGLFSAITTLGTPLDVTVQELRLETFFPSDEASDQILRQLVDDAAAIG